MKGTTHHENHPLPCANGIDAVLGSLAARYREAMDPLLDLKLDTGRKANPGMCVQTYFWLANRLPAAAANELRQVRAWLEGIIEVLAFKRGKEIHSRRSLRLESESLEQYCTEVMRDFRRRTANTPCDLELQFAYRG